MKRSLLLAISLTICKLFIAQNGEFTKYSNGLIYSENTMNQLAYIVDSLNLKYQYCDLNKTFYSRSQAIGHIIKLDTGDIKGARKAVKAGISLEDFKATYPLAKIKENVLVVRYKYKDSGKDVIEFKEISLTNNYGFSIIKSTDLDKYSQELKGPWISHYSEKAKYWNESLRAFYLPEGFTNAPLPEKYARMVGYSDCLIDTNATKFKENLKYGHVGLPKRWQSFSTKKKTRLLDEMRSTRVVGQCSQDDSPRRHAVNIAMLSAETANWEVFLRAHLDVMNDRFERVSDGSYAWAQRKTYIRELEEININVADLILGICLRVENPAKNHYFGSIGRVGRALSETQNRAAIESELIAMIEDDELDYFNRVLAFFLFDNYIYHTPEPELKTESTEKLKQAINTLPEYMSERMASRFD